MSIRNKKLTIRFIAWLLICMVADHMNLFEKLPIAIGWNWAFFIGAIGMLIYYKAL